MIVPVGNGTDSVQQTGFGSRLGVVPFYIKKQRKGAWNSKW